MSNKLMADVLYYEYLADEIAIEKYNFKIKAFYRKATPLAYACLSDRTYLDIYSLHSWLRMISGYIFVFNDDFIQIKKPNTWGRCKL